MTFFVFLFGLLCGAFFLRECESIATEARVRAMEDERHMDGEL